VPAVPYIFPRLKDIVSRGDDLPTLPTIVLQLHRVLDDPRAGAADVAAVIEQDPALAARVLRAVNSAAFTRGGAPVTALAAAVARLGVNQVRAVCVVLAVVKAFGSRKGRLDHRVFWVHSATVAQLTRELWDRVGLAPDITPDDAYVVGLLHDVGLLIIDQFFHADLDEMLLHRRQDEPLWPLEELHLGLDHGTVAGLLLGRWQLPGFVADAVSHHNHPGEAPSGVAQLAKMVAAAEAMCWECGVGLELEGRPLTPAAALLEAIGVPPREVDGLLASVAAAHERAASFLT
jgi:HD-like signal output (HDOD) protein